MKPILKSYLVEINVGNSVPGNNSNVLFQDFPQLRDVYIFGILGMDANTLTTSPTGKTLVTANTGTTITLLDTFNQEIIKQYPVVALDPWYMSGFYRDFKPFPLQLTKSYITITSNTGINANESYCFNIFYLEKKEYDKQLSTKSGDIRRRK
jgi:hypothetical protein